jgi:hemoglobin-like flavoprotein
MSEMTREHLEAVRNDAMNAAIANMLRSANVEHGKHWSHVYDRLAEVAAMIEAKLESRDEG